MINDGDLRENYTENKATTGNIMKNINLYFCLLNVIHLQKNLAKNNH